MVSLTLMTSILCLVVSFTSLTTIKFGLVFECNCVWVFCVGSTESTFSFRIREDRQMMKFSRESTFNQLCGRKDNDSDHTSCDPPTFWGMPEGLMMEKARKQQKKTEL